MDHLDSIQVTYVSGINHGRETEILRFRTYVPGSNPHDVNKVFYNLVIMYWTLNSIYMQFEYQYSKSRKNVSVDHVQLSGDVLFENRNPS